MNERKLRLQRSRLRHIRNLVSECLRKASVSSAPVPVERIADFLGAKVLYAPYEGDDLAGMLTRQNGRPIIGVNSAHHKNRQRFTIAHECGHLALGHSSDTYLDSGFPSALRRDANSSKAQIIEEIEANQFAAELLMPLRFIARDIRNQNADIENDIVTARLAKRYKVSNQAMAFRIANLDMERALNQ